MNQFLIEAEISQRIPLEDIVDVIGYSMGLSITLNEGYDENDYDKEMLKHLLLSKTFNIDKPIGKGNFAQPTSLLQGDFEQNIQIYRNKNKRETVVIIEDMLGQKNIIKETPPFYGLSKKLEIKTTDTYSLYVMKNVVDFFGGTLMIDKSVVLKVSSQNAKLLIDEKIFKALNYAKEKIGIDITAFKTYEDPKTKEIADNIIYAGLNITNQLEINRTQALLTVKAPNLKDVDKYKNLLPMMDSSRLELIAKNEKDNNKVLIQDWVKLMGELVRNNEKTMNKEETLEEKRTSANERNSLVKRRVR